MNLKEILSWSGIDDGLSSKHKNITSAVSHKSDDGFKSRLGQCYILSWRAVSNQPGYKLVHGYITSRQGNTIDHAWCETETEVYDPVLDWKMPKDAYYALFRAEKEKEYSAEEAMELSSTFGTYGPWHEITREIKTSPSKRKR
jgi:hypothetical protein